MPSRIYYEKNLKFMTRCIATLCTFNIIPKLQSPSLHESNKLKLLVCSQSSWRSATFQTTELDLWSETLISLAIISPLLDFRLECEKQIELKTRLKVLTNLLAASLLATRFKSLNKFIYKFRFFSLYSISISSSFMLLWNIGQNCRGGKSTSRYSKHVLIA